MNRWTVIRRSLWFYRRTHLGVLLGAAVATAVLVGALAVGDSVRDSLREQALLRLGKVELALAPSDQLFEAGLAARVGRHVHAPAAAVLQMPGMISLPDDSARANNVRVLGVDEAFWHLGPTGNVPKLPPDQVLLSQSLARQLRVDVGDSVVLRADKPSLLPREAPLSSDAAEDASFSDQLAVAAIVDDDAFGRFGLSPSQAPPYNAFVPLDWLQKRSEQPGKANVLLLGPRTGSGQGDFAQAAGAAIQSQWRLADAGLELRELPALHMLELRTSRVFLQDAAVAAARVSHDQAALGILTYFVNEIRAGRKTTPYSMVTGYGLLERGTSQAATAPMNITDLFQSLPDDLKDDEIVLNDWEADDLGLAKAGTGAFPAPLPSAEKVARPRFRESSGGGKAGTDPVFANDAKAGSVPVFPATIDLTYYTLGPMRQLMTQGHTFRLRGARPMQRLAGDSGLMPDFPGITGAEDCRDWKAGVPIDQKKIRPKDEEYWREHRGTPKAFVSLAAAQRIWGNRFGQLTAVRWRNEPDLRAKIESELMNRLRPQDLGFVWMPIREQAMAASSPTTDFAGLFLGLSFFLVIAALMLCGLLFSFALQHRGGEVGTLLALGLRPGQVRRLMMSEALSLAAVGSAIGTAAGLGYAHLMLQGLRTVWSQATASAVIHFSVHGSTPAIGFAAGTLAAAVSMAIVLRRQAKMPARALIAGDPLGATPRARKAGRARNIAGWACLVLSFAGAAAMALGSGGRSDPSAAGAFFGAGTLLLAGCLLAAAKALAAMSRGQGLHTLCRLSARNVTWRKGRSLATLGLLACGVFLVTAVGANRHDPAEGASRKDSGTGGFAQIGRPSLPIWRDLNRPDAQQAFGLAGKLPEVRFAHLRVRPGAAADCLNLNRVAQPELLGADPSDLAGRFTFVKALGGGPSDGWKLLDARLDGGAVPAIADENTITWSLGLKLGDSLEYTDDAGRSVKIRLVGMIANSILQGSVLISSESFRRHFDSHAGTKMLLIDCPAAGADAASSLLAQKLWANGLELTKASRRLEDLNSVENAYLSIFQVLGGLGLLLGSVGLALVVLRNVLERRGELALMRAVGFAQGRVAALVLAEHLALLAAGLAIGIACAGIAIWPSLASPGAAVPYASLGLTLLAVAANGVFWTVLATRWSLRGDLIRALLHILRRSPVLVNQRNPNPTVQ